MPSDLARLLGGLAELHHRNHLLLDAASNRLCVSLIPMAQLSCDDQAKVRLITIKLIVNKYGVYVYTMYSSVHVISMFVSFC